MIRAKFVVVSVTKYQGNSASVIMEPRYSKTISEDKRFSEATPSGKLEMYLNNQVVIDQLQPGTVWYIDMELAPIGTSAMHE